MDYRYENAPDSAKALLPPGFQGNVHRLSDSWSVIMPVRHESCKILEIGAYHGANVCSLVKTYATHEASEVHCVDPWLDYGEYPEYKHQQPTNYSIFLNNIAKLAPSDLHKVYVHRGLSEHVVPSFEDNTFDIIFVDGNHQLQFTLEDAIMSVKKLKRGVWIIIDDLQAEQVMKAASIFVDVYRPYFHPILNYNNQLFLQRKIEDS